MTNTNPAQNLLCFLPVRLLKFFHARRLSENRTLLRKSEFWPNFPIKFVKYNKYSPHVIETMDSKPLSLATDSILGQSPSTYLYIPQRTRCDAAHTFECLTKRRFIFISAIQCNIDNLALFESITCGGWRKLIRPTFYPCYRVYLQNSVAIPAESSRSYDHQAPLPYRSQYAVRQT